MRVKKGLLLGEWAVLALLCEKPSHGYALAAMTGPDGPVGQIWTVRPAQVYRAIEVLEKLGLVEVESTEPGDGGPTRTEMTATATGRQKVDKWLYQPEQRLRNLRSAFLLKLILLRRRGLPELPLLEAQRSETGERVRGLRVEVEDSGEEFPIIEIWRLGMGEAGLDFIGRMIEQVRQAEGPATGR